MKLGIAGIKGTSDNYEAVNNVTRNIFKYEETELIIGKIYYYSGPVRDLDKTKTLFVTF